MGGLRKYMPITHATMAVGWLAICGFPLLSGFFSKDEILFQAFTTTAFGDTLWGKALWAVGAVTALLTAIYMTRLMVLTFWSEERYQAAHGDPEEKHNTEHAVHGDHNDEAPHHDAAEHDEHHHGLAPGQKPHETGWSMTLPLVVLAIAAAVGGYVGVPNGLGKLVGWQDSNRFEHFLAPVLEHHAASEHAATPERATTEPAPAAPTHGAESAAAEHDASTELALTGVSVVIAILGIALGFFIFSRNPLLHLPKLLEDKWRIDELYEAAVIRPLNWLSTNVLWKVVDVKGIDGIVNGVAGAVRGFGGSIRGLQTGLARSYVAVILLGAAALVGYFLAQGSNYFDLFKK
jgi:NADH-quinone oxidoreductase subunit L